ncbi:MAG: Gldg family protein [Planctomycetota bacterium]|nr:Gldg family protein [Planctomycetota bacterium]
MQGRNFRIRSLSWLSSGLLLVVLVMLNGVLARAGSRLDLTEEGLYTLTDGSRAILGRLKDPVTVKVFWHDVPVRFDHTKRYVSALLEEMSDASNGKVKSTWVDMSEDSGQEEASELGVEPYVFTVMHGKEARQAKGYMSLVIEMGEEPPRAFDVLFQLQDQLEYLIVATVFQRSRTELPVVGIVSNRTFNPFGGPQQGPFSDFEGMMQRTFGAGARTDVSLDEAVAEGIDVLILARPRDLTEAQVARFEQYLLAGGRGIVLEDPADLENVLGRDAMSAEPHPSGLEGWLGHLGVTVERGAVADFEFPSGFPRSQQEFLRYPYWPQVQREGMDSENPVMRNTPPMTLYWPAAISVDAPRQAAAGRTVTVLARTSGNGYRRGDITGLGRADESPEGKLLESVPLIVLVEGPLQSYWLGKPDPTAKAPDAADARGGGIPGFDLPGPDAPRGDEPGEPVEPDEPGEGSGSPDGAPADDAPGKDADEKKADEKKPAEPEDEGDGDEDADATEEESGDDESAEGPPRLETGAIRLLVMGDADFLDGRLMNAWVTRYVNGNIGPGFVLGAAEWMSGSDELLALRARAMNPRNLDEIEDSTQSLLKSLNLFLVPLLVILAGLTMFFVRRMA